LLHGRRNLLIDEIVFDLHSHIVGADVENVDRIAVGVERLNG
jgi:hypothetical protein